MSVAYQTAIVMFTAGFLLLLGWAYLTLDNPRSTKILVKSLGLFVLPGAAIWTLPGSIYAFPLSMWVAVFAEECLKAFAARTEHNSRDKFWLVALFGIWELMLAKSLWSVTGGQVTDDWGRGDMLTVGFGAAVVVLMHVVTAVIYAFHFRNRLWLALLASWVVHTIFNELAHPFGISPIASGIKAVLLLILLAVLWPISPADPTTKSRV